MLNRKELHPLALQMAEDLMKARPNLPLATSIGVANYKMAALAGQLGIQLDTRSGFGKTPANIYQLLLIGSGAGKGASQGLIDNFYFKDAWEYIDDVVYPKFRAKAVEVLETTGSERPIHNWVKEVASVTESGLLAMAESYHLTKIGGLNLSIDEIGNSVISKADVFEMLLTPYDNGTYVPKAKRSDAESMTITNMNTCLFAFGNKERLFEGDFVEQAFLKLLSEGYARRLIVIDDESIPARRTPEDVVREMEVSEKIISDRKGIREDIKSLITKSNLGMTLPLSKEAVFEWATIKSDGDNYILDNKGLEQSVKSDMSERCFKTAKLACVYAFFDKDTEVSGKHMKQAFEVIKESSAAIAGLVKIKPIQERLLESLLNEEKAVTSSHMLGYKYINSTWTKKINEYIDLAKEMSSERDLIWKESSRKGVSYYRVTEQTEEDKEELDEIDKTEKQDTRKRTKAEQLALLN